ncbi:hypothetical protein J6590_062700 [Homalodisca vitripennis]|nr:hypothetical protein J6590_062700 [Homalodisca vitripennis]
MRPFQSRSKVVNQVRIPNRRFYRIHATASPRRRGPAFLADSALSGGNPRNYFSGTYVTLTSTRRHMFPQYKVMPGNAPVGGGGVQWGGGGRGVTPPSLIKGTARSRLRSHLDCVLPEPKTWNSREPYIAWRQDRSSRL